MKLFEIIVNEPILILLLKREFWCMMECKLVAQPIAMDGSLLKKKMHNKIYEKIDRNRQKENMLM